MRHEAKAREFGAEPRENKISSASAELSREAAAEVRQDFCRAELVPLG
jgi:hypothetical protein